MESVYLESHDLGEVEDLVSKMYSRMHLGGGERQGYARISRQVMTPGLAFDELDYSFEFAYDAEPQPALVISSVLTETVHRVGQGGEATIGPGELFVICPPDLPYAGTVYGANLRHLTIDPAALKEVARTAYENQPVRLLDYRPVSRQAATDLQQAITYVRETVLESSRPPSALVLSTARQYLAARILDTFPTTAVEVDTATDRHDAHPQTVRRAVALIEAQPDADLTLTAIAQAAYVTPRALQLAFRRHLGCTPMGYLRQVRLDRARQDLLAVPPGSGRTVAAVASRWGFGHPGRFAAAYREAYGESPSQTLLR